MASWNKHELEDWAIKRKVPSRWVDYQKSGYTATVGSGSLVAKMRIMKPNNAVLDYSEDIMRQVEEEISKEEKSKKKAIV